MKGLLNTAGRHSLARFFGGIRRSRLGVVALGGLVSASLLSVTRTGFAEATTISLSPALAKSTLLSAMDPAREITIQLALPLSDAKGAKEFTDRISNPKDPLYRHFITVKEFAARFGGNVADFEAVKAWLWPMDSPSRMSLLLAAA